MRHAIFANFCALLSVGLIDTATADPVTLRVGQVPSTVRSVSSLHFAIGMSQGFYAREGIKLELVPIAGGTNKMAATVTKTISRSRRRQRPI